MVKYDREILLKAILREYKCSEGDAVQLLNYMKGVSDELQHVLDEWSKNGTISNFSVNGVDIKYIMNKMNTSFLAALVHMSKFIANPSDAERFKRLRVMIKDVNPNGGK